MKGRNSSVVGDALEVDALKKSDIEEPFGFYILFPYAYYPQFHRGEVLGIYMHALDLIF